MLQADLRSHINTLRGNYQSVAVKTDPSVLYRKATDLWNLGVRYSRTTSTADGKNNDASTAATNINTSNGLLRAFAFMVLHCAHRGRGDTSVWNDHVKLFRTAIRAAKTCLDTAQLDICTAILERAVDIETSMGSIREEIDDGQRGDGASHDDRLYTRLRTEYYGLRVVLVVANNTWHYLFRPADDISGVEARQT